MEKTCKKCGFKGINFRKSRSICIECQKQYGRDNYYKHHSAEDQKRRSEKQKERRLQNPVPWMLSACKARAKKSKLEFNLDKEDIFIPKLCPVLGIELIMAKGKMNHNSPTLDRINNKLGYIKGNVRVISWRANSLKSDATINEVELILDYMLKHNKT